MRMRASAVFALLLLARTGAAQTHVNRCVNDKDPVPGRMDLDRAIAGGGRIVFDCPPNTSIRMTAGHTAPAGTLIDGGGNVTLDAHGIQITMFWAPSGDFALANITIQNAAQFHLALGRLGSVIHSFGDVSLDNVTISGSESPIHIGGGGRITGSRFLGNQGLAVSIRGEAHVEQSTFIGNQTGLSVGLGTVHKSFFGQNTSGALRVAFPAGEVRIIAATFDANDGQGAILLSQRSAGGAAGVVVIRRSTFTNNHHSFAGGAINVYDNTVDAPISVRATLQRFPPARFVLAYDRFAGNGGRSGGAIRADLGHTAGMVVQGGTFTGNVGQESGGAIAWEGGSLLVTHSVLKSNRTAGQGSALFAQSLHAGARWTVANSLIVENVGPAQGGAVEAGPASLVNVTVAKNEGFGIVGTGASRPAISNAILSENTAGNCRGLDAAAFRGGNLQFGRNDCPGVALANPYLDALYVPVGGSPALTLGDVGICRAAPVSRTDIVFQSRGALEYCALGAFESPPIRRIPRRREER
ncbi:MAG: hypothetical protein ABJC61_02725 [Acidobacteriota bacterium]